MKEFTSQIRKCASVDKVEREIRGLHRRMKITRDTNVSVVNGFVKDIEWNAMDLWHRIWVHNTYLEHMQVFSGRDFAVNVTRLGKLPFFSQVANAKLAPGLIYQTMVMWGVFYVHQIVQLAQEGEKVRITVTWYIASHRLFSLLHRPFNWRLRKLQLVQDEEDREIRDRRCDIRKAGFRFDTDEFDFLNSNELTDQLRHPRLEAPVEISLNGLEPGQTKRLAEGTVELLVERTPEGLKVWPGICPHAGAEFRPEHLCEGVIHCHWHGRKFSPVTLNDAKRSWRFLDREIEMRDDDTLVVTSVE